MTIKRKDSYGNWVTTTDDLFSIIACKYCGNSLLSGYRIGTKYNNVECTNFKCIMQRIIEEQEKEKSKWPNLEVKKIKESILDIVGNIGKNIIKNIKMKSLKND